MFLGTDSCFWGRTQKTDLFMYSTCFLSPSPKTTEPTAEGTPSETVVEQSQEEPVQEDNNGPISEG